MKIDGFSAALEKLKQKLSEHTKELTIDPFPKVLFLGTGSCIPNKTRNTSGILLQMRYCNFCLVTPNLLTTIIQFF